MTNFRHPVVYIFGAGATRGALSRETIPPPTDVDFFDIANQIKGRRTPKLAKVILGNVWKLYGRTSGIRLEAAYRDIETRAIIGEMVKPKNQPKQWGKIQREFVELVRRVYVHTTCNEEKKHLKPKQSQIHKDILKFLKEGDTIVTFNYDLLIEESFETAELWNPITGYGAKFGGHMSSWGRRWFKGRNHDGSESKIKLLKLHGSINWEASGRKLSENPYSVQGANRKNKTWRNQPISILAPGWKKDIEKKPYCDFWKLAGKELSRCRTLIILGYSLPETDLVARSLFAEVVRNRAVRQSKNKLSQLHIADPSPDVKEKFINLFADVLDSDGRVYQYGGIEEFSNANIIKQQSPTLQYQLDALKDRVDSIERKLREGSKSRNHNKVLCFLLLSVLLVY